VALFQYLNEKFSTKHRISVERVVSGIGLANVYEFLAQYYPNRVDVAFQKAFEQAVPDEKPALVSKRAHEDYDKEQQKEQPVSLCRLAMNIMMSAYGCEVGSSAIKWIPTGGLFVTGGLTPKNMKFIAGNGSEHTTEFMKSYLHKGRVSTLLQRIPLYAVLVEDLGVRGAHKAAQMAFEQYQREHSNGIMTAPATNNQNNSSSAGCGAVKLGMQEWPWCVSFMATAALGFAVGAVFSKKNKGL
jgi:glucokinase